THRWRGTQVPAYTGSLPASGSVDRRRVHRGGGDPDPGWTPRRSRSLPGLDNMAERSAAGTGTSKRTGSAEPAGHRRASARDRVRLLAGGQEAHRWRALFGQLQVDPRGCQVDQLAGGIDRQVHRLLVAELLELALVVALDPARGGDLHRLEDRIDAVLVLEPVGGHVELEHADRAQDQVVA